MTATASPVEADAAASGTVWPLTEAQAGLW